MLCELVLRLGIALQTHGAHMLEIAFHAIATLPVVLLKANLFAPWISLGLLAVASRCSPQLAASATASPAAPA